MNKIEIDIHETYKLQVPLHLLIIFKEDWYIIDYVIKNAIKNLLNLYQLLHSLVYCLFVNTTTK